MDLSTLTRPDTQRAGAATAGQLVEAVIATTAAAVSDDVFVLIGNAQQRSGPVEWVPRGDLLPTRGDRCYVEQSSTGKLVLVQFGVGAAEPSASSDLHYTHEQTIASATWTIVHPLGKHPSVTVVDSAGTRLHVGEVQTGPTTVVLSFSGATTGKAFLN
jgi:hypothetical protein